MEFEQAKKYVKTYMQPEDKDFYQLMMKHIDLLENDKEITRFDEKQTKDYIRSVTKRFIHSSLSIETLQFYEGFSQLVYNWNLYVLQDPDIELYCEILKDLVNVSITLSNVSDTMQKAYEKLHLFRNWNPPAFKITKPYLEELFKEVENEKNC